MISASVTVITVLPFLSTPQTRVASFLGPEWIAEQACEASRVFQQSTIRFLVGVMAGIAEQACEASRVSQQSTIRFLEGVMAPEP